MPVSEDEEWQLGVSPQGSDPVTGVPIKKRPFRISQPSCPPSEASSQQFDGPSPFIWGRESPVLDDGACSALGTHDTTNGSTLQPRGELSADSDVNLLSRHRSLIKPEFQECGLKNATYTGKVVAKVQGPNLGDKSVSWPGMEYDKLSTDLRKSSELLIGKGSGEEKFALSDKSAFQRVTKIPELQLGTTTDVRGLNYVKQEKLEYSSGVLPTTESGYGDTDSKVDSANQSIHRSNWDLNIPIDTWVSSVNDPALEYSGNDRSSQRAISEEKVGACLVDMTSRGANATCVPFEKYASQNRDNRLSKLSMPDDLSHTEVGLDLQLKPPCKPGLRVTWGASELSLSLTGNMKDASFVKAEPCEMSSQQNVQKVEAGSVKAASFRTVKSEPCDGNLLGEATLGAGSCDPKLACGKLVKSEPTEWAAQDSVKRSMEKSPTRGCGGSRTTSGEPEVLLDARLAREIDLNSETVSEDDKLNDGVAALNVSSTPLCTAADGSVDLVSRSEVPGCELSLKTEDVQSDTSIPQDAGGVLSKAPDSVSRSAASEGGGSSSTSRTCDDANLNSTLETATPDHKEPTSHDGMSEGSADMDCTDDDHVNLSKLATVHELLMDSYGNQIEEGTCLPEEIQKGEIYSRKDEPNVSDGVVGAIVKTLKPSGANGDYADGEVGDPKSRANMDHACDGNKASLHVDVRAKHVQIASEVQAGHYPQKSEGDLSCYTHDTGVTSLTGGAESSSAGVPTTSSSKKKLVRPSHGTSQDQVGEEQGQELKSKPSGSTSVKSVGKRHADDVGGRQEKARVSDVLVKQSVSSEREKDVNGSAVELVDHRSKHAKTKDSTSNRLSLGKSKSFSSKSDPSQVEEERSRRDRSHSRGSRHERSNDKSSKYENGSSERSSKYENGKSQDQPVAKRGADLLNARWANRHLRPLHCDRNSEPGFRSMRPKNGSDDAFAVSSDGPVKRAGRMVRRLPEDEPLRLRRFSQRRSPGLRGGGGLRGRGPSPLGAQADGFPARNVSPGRCIGSEVPDSLRLSQEEKLMRAIPDDMLEPFPFPHRLQYDQAENIIIRRGERSLSPLPRRGPLVRRSQWSPSRRSPEVFNGHLEIMRRSPPVVRIGRMRSPGTRPCFAEDTMLRRRGTPPYGSRIAGMEDHDLPRFGRDLQRNVRRFEVIGPEEPTDGEHVRPMHFAELPEPTVDDEFVDRRKFEARQGFGRPFAQRRFVAGDDGEEGLPFPGEDGPSRPVRFCPEEDEGFPERGSPREFDGPIRNRIGSISSRLRGLGEGEERRFHGAQGWRDGAFNDLRLKRRRF